MIAKVFATEDTVPAFAGMTYTETMEEFLEELAFPNFLRVFPCLPWQNLMSASCGVTSVNEDSVSSTELSYRQF